MRVIFLDFDGVLINEESFLPENKKKGKRPKPTESMVARMNKIINETGAKIVVSSSWRTMFTIEQLRDLVKSWGIDAEVHGAISHRSTWLDDRPNVRRTREICLWIGEYVGILQSICILDDMRDMWPLDRYHVRPDPARGLSDVDADEAILKLIS